MVNGNEAFAEYPVRYRWWEQLFELFVFLALIVPAMVIGLFVKERTIVAFPVLAVATMANDLALFALIVFFLWRNGEGDARIGLTWKNGWSDVILGVFLFSVVFIVAGFLDAFLRRLGFSGPSTAMMKELMPRGMWQVLLGVVLVTVVALAEETIFRGYLIHRLSNLTGSMVAAVIISSVIFALPHVYEGVAGAITVGVMGLMFALVYVWRGSLVAPIVAHFMQDFIGIVLLPVLTHVK